MFPSFIRSIPAALITKDQAALFEAARLSLIRRAQHAYGDSFGWPGAWRISLYARFEDLVQCSLINSYQASNL